MSLGARLVARAIGASAWIDWAYGRFVRLRAVLVTAYASDAALAAYNDLTYADNAVYDPDTSAFREHLFNWEKDLVSRVFPAAPARILVGGAGGGREAFQLAERGYEVTAFEPSPGLANAMQRRAAAGGGRVQAFVGRYEELPVVQRPGRGERVDLSAGARFDAAILGWSSYSHIRRREHRIAALKEMAALTDGPVALSFFTPARHAPPRTGKLRRVVDSLGRRSAGDAFTVHIGYYRLSGPEELAGEVEAAGLSIVAASYDDSDGHFPWIAVSRPQDVKRATSAG